MALVISPLHTFRYLAGKQLNCSGDAGDVHLSAYMGLNDIADRIPVSFHENN